MLSYDVALNSMEAILAEINRKRKEASEQNDGKKYQRRGDSNVTAIPDVVIKTVAKPEPELESKQRQVSEDQTISNTSIDISLTEIIRRLRSLNEPIRLFAESDLSLYRRLKTLSSREERSHAQNDFSLAWKSTSDSLQQNVFDQAPSQPSPLIVDYDFGLISQKHYAENPEATRVILQAYLSHLLDAWEIYLRERSDDVKSSGSGKM
jgi:pre-mRNA processing factor 4 (PRP4) like